MADESAMDLKPMCIQEVGQSKICQPVERWKRLLDNIIKEDILIVDAIFAVFEDHVP